MFNKNTKNSDYVANNIACISIGSERHRHDGGTSGGRNGVQAKAADGSSATLQAITGADNSNNKSNDRHSSSYDRYSKPNAAYYDVKPEQAPRTNLSGTSISVVKRHIDDIFNISD